MRENTLLRFTLPALLTASLSSLASAQLSDTLPGMITCAGCGAGGADVSEDATGAIGYSRFPGWRLTDSFNVPTTVTEWSIRRIRVFNYMTGSPTSPSPIDTLTMQVWDGPPGDAGSTVIWGDLVTNVLAASAWTGIYRIPPAGDPLNTDRAVMYCEAQTSGLCLPPGDYWVDYMTAGSASFTGPWGPSNPGSVSTTSRQTLDDWATFTLLPETLPLQVYGTTDCACGSLPADQFEENDACAAAVLLCDGQYTSLNVTKNDPDYYAVEVNPGDTLAIDLFFSHAVGDTDIFLYDGLTTCELNEAPGHNCANSLVCGFSASDNESIVWTNTTGTTQIYLVEVNIWGPTITGQCNVYDMVVSGARCAGDIQPGLCSTAIGCAGALSANIDGSFTGPGAVHLEITGGPSGQNGYLFVGTDLVDPGIPFGQGSVCLGGALGRYNPVAGAVCGNAGLVSLGTFDNSGIFQNTSGTSTVLSGFDVPFQLPNGAFGCGGPIPSGAQLYFQCWHRCSAADGGGWSYSDVVGVTFP